MSYRYKYIEFDQPSGTFYLTAVKATEILEFYTIDRREYTGSKARGIQRTFSDERIKKIAEYVTTSDASFPTTILMALSEDDYEITSSHITLKGKAEVIDGQHRILGIERARKLYGNDTILDFILPVVFILEPTEEQKALLFAIVNGTQTKVPASIVYDLFGTSESRDPFKTCHEIARTLNFSQDSPFYKKLKMLGKKTNYGEDESLSQGTFVKHLVPLISKDPMMDRNNIINEKELKENPNLPLRYYFINNKDHVILKIMENLFQAVRDVWTKEWNDPQNFILSKSTGYTGIMKSLNEILKKGKEEKSFKMSTFKIIFEKVKSDLRKRKLELKSADFPPGAVGENKFKEIILENIS